MSGIAFTALIENRAPKGLEAEHGLSVYIEYNGDAYLLDTGASDAFSRNAERLGVGLGRVRAAALSHAHYDHSGGWGAFFAQNSDAPVYLREEAKQRGYTKFGPVKKYIGIPDGLLEGCAARFEYVAENTTVAPGVRLIGHSTPGLERRGQRAHMYRETDSGLTPDDFMHEQSLVFETDSGLVIFNSCCHGGADTVVREVNSALPETPVAALVGGFHLMGPLGAATLGVKPEEADALGESLSELGVRHTYTCHCTGAPGFERLAAVMGERVSYFQTGDTVRL